VRYATTLLAAGAAALTALSAAPVRAQRATETGFLNRTVIVGGRTFRYQVFVPSAYDSAREQQQWPVILFLHGAGERGSDGLLQTQVGLGPAIRERPSRVPAIVVFPQVPADSGWVGSIAQMALAALDQTMKEFRTDPTRVYLTGLSMGGNGAWYIAYRNPTRFAAIAPICGWASPEFRWKIDPVVPAQESAGAQAYDVLARKLARVPTWIWHGEIDDVVPVEESRKAAAAFTAAGANVRYSEVPGTGHNSWDAAYRSPKFWEWLLAQRRGR
jgi:predicted peptidase